MLMGWNKEKAIEHLDQFASTKSQGHCAAYTREAIEAGGIVLTRHVKAKDYGTSLTGAGFTPLKLDSGKYQSGDVVIIEGFEGNSNGHMAMYDGKKWVSDFVQSGLYPGPTYRKKQPKYTIYRYGTPQDNAK
jgi:hypothetical protein